MLKFFIATLACALILNASANDNYGRRSNRLNLLSKAVGARMLSSTVPVDQTVQDVSGQFVPITRTSGSQTQFTPEQIQQLQQLQQLMAQQQQQQKPVVQQQTQQFVQQPVVQQQTQQFVQTTTVRPTTGLEQQLLEQQMLTQRLQDQLKLIQQQQQQKLQQQQIQQQNLLQQLQTFEGRPQSNQVPVAAPVEPAQRVQFQSVQGIVNNTVRVPVQQVQQVQQVPVQQVQQVQQVPVQQVPVQQVQKFQQIPLTGAVPNFQQQQLQQQQLQLQQLQQLQKQQQQQQQQVTVQGVNDEICNNAQPGDLIAHPTDAAQFVICYGFGEFTVMDCPEMLVYNAHLKRCDVNTEAPMLCKSNPCVNGGKCVELSTAQFKCECASGFGGQFCEKLDTCSTRPCGNEGVCIPFVLGSPVAHVCLCNGGRSIGPSCQRTEPNPCLSVNTNSRLLPVGLNPSVFAHCEGSRPHFKFCQPPLVFSAARQECEWA